MTRYEQDFCSRCNKKCDFKKAVSLVTGRAAHPGSPKYTSILLICENCTESFGKWLLKCKTEHDMDSFVPVNFALCVWTPVIDNAKEEMR